jgi:hypothetical protein
MRKSSRVEADDVVPLTPGVVLAVRLVLPVAREEVVAAIGSAVAAAARVSAVRRAGVRALLLTAGRSGLVARESPAAVRTSAESLSGVLLLSFSFVVEEPAFVERRFLDFPCLSFAMRPPMWILE